MTYNPVNTKAPYLQTSLYFPDDFDEFRVKFTAVFQDIANCVNVREISIYNEVENLTGELWPVQTPVPGDTSSQRTRQTFRKIFFFSDATLTFNHGIVGATLFTHIYGTATDGTIFFPIPYVFPPAQQIGIRVTSTQVVIQKAGGAPAITNGTVVLEYLKV